VSIFKQKPYIVAEVGSNIRSFDDAKNAVTLAANVGADAVKFQFIQPGDLYGSTDSKSLFESEWLAPLSEKAEACGIDFMCTAFSVEGYNLVHPHVKYHKVASCEANHVRILERLQHLGKPVLLSTGALTEPEIDVALKILEGVPVVILYCEAAYPAVSIDTRKIRWMRGRFKRDIGFSDHTTDYIEIPALAFDKGAVVIEKHFNPLGLKDTPDAPHSLSCDQFKTMVKRIRGDLPVVLGPVGSEAPIIMQHKRRLIATRDIQPGETLTENENFGIYRSLKPMSLALGPYRLEQVIGKKATRSISAGDGIGPQDFE
jgi:N,N'-diacetyllegionaminate synthase